MSGDQDCDVSGFSTLSDVLACRAAEQPFQRAYSFLKDGEDDEETITYADLDGRARAIAAEIIRLGGRGERALLLYPPGIDYIAALFGCLYAGCVAVPAYPPRPTAHDPALGRLRAMVANARPRLALTTAAVQPLLATGASTMGEFRSIELLATDTVDSSAAEGWSGMRPSGDDIALLQYTSGSTALPRGVVLTHHNFLADLHQIARSLELTPASRGVIWLPPYHDMGLIGGLLLPPFVGCPVTLMSPVACVQQPIRWLRTISRVGATASGGPNFAYELCVRKISASDRAGLDLSSWEVAFAGAEPVRAATLSRFAAAFGPCGFRREAFYPTYGLAEATLLVSGGQVRASPVVHHVNREALAAHRIVFDAVPASATESLVGCGSPVAGVEVVIVDPDTCHPCSPETVGEIWVAGPNVAQGYWERPDDTERTFGGRRADDGSGPYLRTGDLGYMHRGELVVTGRLKDLMVIRGRNYYPHDIEETVEHCDEALRPGGGVAFLAGPEDEERLVVVHEVRRDARELDSHRVIAAMRRSVAEQHGLQISSVVLVRAGSVPKTTSGKLQHRASRQIFQSGGFTRFAIGSAGPPMPEIPGASATRER